MADPAIKNMNTSRFGSGALNQDMIRNSNETQQPGFFASLIQDDGVQRATAGVVVAVVLAAAKNLIFSKAS